VHPGVFNVKKQNLTVAIVMIVLLRVSIGWQFLYEGLWKIDSQSTAKPWTAEGYLKNSAGPLRPFFRAMTGDPDDFKWLDLNHMTKKWDVWKKRFADHYQLSEIKRIQLNQLVNGYGEFRVKLKKMPKDVVLRGSLARVVRYDEKNRDLVVSGEFTNDPRKPRVRMLPRERDLLVALAKGDDDDSRKYRAAIKYMFVRASARLSFKERLAASLGGDPERAGIIDDKHKGTIDHKRMGQIELYRTQVARYEKNLANAKQTFNHLHLKQQFAELQQLRAKVVGPSKALERGMKAAAKKLLTQKQLTMGPPSLPWTPLDWTSFQTIMGLTVLGFLLIAGLFTRIAAVGGALMLLSFYLVMPPWPGMPPAPGPEHSLFVNKNLIEVIALIAIVFLPTGKWFGLDNFLDRWLNRDDDDEMEDTGRSSTTIGAQEVLEATYDDAESDAPAESDADVESAAPAKSDADVESAELAESHARAVEASDQRLGK
jgi:uncharacterized membrane protein YphA (DoxX/SURF4 family)